MQMQMHIQILPYPELILKLKIVNIVWKNIFFGNE